MCGTGGRGVASCGCVALVLGVLQTVVCVALVDGVLQAVGCVVLEVRVIQASGGAASKHSNTADAMHTSCCCQVKI